MCDGWGSCVVDKKQNIVARWCYVVAGGYVDADLSRSDGAERDLDETLMGVRMVRRGSWSNEADAGDICCIGRVDVNRGAVRSRRWCAGHRGARPQGQILRRIGFRRLLIPRRAETQRSVHAAGGKNARIGQEYDTTEEWYCRPKVIGGVTAQLSVSGS